MVKPLGQGSVTKQTDIKFQSHVSRCQQILSVSADFKKIIYFLDKLIIGEKKSNNS